MTDPVEHVDSWLKRQGYPGEYQVARELQKVGFRVWQGLYYNDTEGIDAKTREIDVVAAEWPPDTERTADVELVVEVKRSWDPWVVLTTSVEADLASTAPMRLVSDVARPMLDGMLNSPPVPDLLTFPERHGYNVVQALGAASTSDQSQRERNRPNPAYIALTGVVKASADRLRLLSKRAVIVFPVIVVDGPLVQLGYDGAGERILNQVVRHRLLWRGSTATAGPVIVDVVQIDHLPMWAPNVRSSTQTIAAKFEQWVTKPKAR